MYRVFGSSLVFVAVVASIWQVCQRSMTDSRVARNRVSADPLPEAKRVGEPGRGIDVAFERATLSARNRSLRAIQVRERWPVENFVGDLVVQIRGDAAQCIESSTGRRRWQSVARNQRNIAWLGEERGILFLAELEPDDPEDADEGIERKSTKLPCAVQRIKLADGKWLPPLEIPQTEAELAAETQVKGLVADADGVFVLSVSENFDREQLKNAGVRYRITRFRRSTSGVDWSRAFAYDGDLPLPGAFLVGSLGPVRDNEAIRPLTKIGSLLIACAGPLEDVMALNWDDGKTIWRIPRIWEYRRGFIGPSVWRHFLGRYGMQQGDVETAALTLEEVRERNKQRGGGHFVSEDYFHSIKEQFNRARERYEGRPGSIVAGPMVIPLQDDNPQDELESNFRVFVAVARSETEEWSNYLSDCIILEVDERGEVIGTLTLPRFVSGTDSLVSAGTLFWRCEQGGFAKLRPSSWLGNAGQIIDLEWRVDHVIWREGSWLTHGTWPDAVAFGGRSMVCVQQGAYLESNNSKVYRFPITVIDLNTHAKTELLLSLPFQGTVTPSSSNYCRSGDEWTTYDSFELVLVRMDVRAGCLAIVIATGEEENPPLKVLEFDLASVVPELQSGYR